MNPNPNSPDQDAALVAAAVKVREAANRIVRDLTYSARTGRPIEVPRLTALAQKCDALADARSEEGHAARP